MTEITGQLAVDITVTVPVPPEIDLWRQDGKWFRPLVVAFRYTQVGTQPLHRWSIPGINVRNIRKNGADGATAYRNIYREDEPAWLPGLAAEADQYVRTTWPWLGPIEGDEDGDS